MNTTEGKFIVIEGIDGAGTTTQSRMLSEWFAKNNLRGVFTFEPSNGPAGLLLRQILSGRTVVRATDGSHRPLSNDVITLLFAADRLDHLDSEVIPWLQKGVHVISDRYYHSSLTYQSLQGDLGWIRSLNGRARVPDITYVLDLPAEQAAQRRQKVRTSEELYESLEQQKLLEKAYRRLPLILANENIQIVDGCMEATSVHLSITTDLLKRFGWEIRSD